MDHELFLKCRFCKTLLKHPFVDLGMSPLANAYLKADQLEQKEPLYPLLTYVCERCFLTQLSEFIPPERLFSQYAYFSSYSESWLKHVKSYTEMMTGRFHLTEASQVIEVASNDGYLLRFFKEKGIPVLGIEPAQNVADVAITDGIPTLVKFFGHQTAIELAQSGQKADLLLGNNVLAHVPDLNDFIEGLKVLLKPHGVLTLEFPHLLCLMKKTQFDTIYHEHFYYFSLIAVEKIFTEHGLTLFDVEELPTHGGSLRIFVQHALDGPQAVSNTVESLREKEIEAGLSKLETYSAFSEQVRTVKQEFLEFLMRVKQEGKSLVGYGAPAKGTVLLNYCGVGTDLMDYTVDLNPHKQGLFLPGSHIPIYPPEKIKETQPDYVLILPWNLKNEVMEQMALIREWGGKFVVPIPRVKVLG